MYSGDGLPAQVCQRCIHQLDTSYNFKLQCENSDTALRQYLNEKQSSFDVDQETNDENCHLSVIENGEEGWRKVLVKVEVKELVEGVCALQQTIERWSKPGTSALGNEKRLSACKRTSNSTETRKAKTSIPDKCGLRNKGLSRSKHDGTYEHVNDELSEDDGIYAREKVKFQIVKKKYICQDCGKSFPQKSNLIAHTRTHTGEKPFSCNKCGKCFGRRSTLQDHSKTHTGEKPYLCEECGKHFTRSSHLKVHLKIHSGEKPFSCSECGKSFAHACHFKDHLLTHSGDKPFCCTKCGKCFTSSSIFKRHLLRHSGEKPFACNECGKRFSGSSDLYIHTRTHTGDKRYCCAECGKRFLLGCHLKDHMKIHSGEKPFSCVECGKCFARKQVLNKHRKSHR